MPPGVPSGPREGVGASKSGKITNFGVSAAMQAFLPLRRHQTPCCLFSGCRFCALAARCPGPKDSRHETLALSHRARSSMDLRQAANNLSAVRTMRRAGLCASPCLSTGCACARCCGVGCPSPSRTPPIRIKGLYTLGIGPYMPHIRSYRPIWGGICSYTRLSSYMERPPY